MSTMGCDASREFLLSAEPQALRAALVGQGHLQTCAACRAHAQRILALHETLDGALASLADRRARAAGPSAGTAALPGAGQAAAGRWRLRRRAAALAMLATAAIVLVFVWQQEPRPAAPLPPLAGPTERVPSSPTVNAAGGSGVAVMPTNDPDITVVWTF